MKFIYLMLTSFIILSCAKKNQETIQEESQIEQDNMDANEYPIIEGTKPSILIHDIWALIALNGESNLIFLGDRPTLEINPTQKSVLGNGGCNRFSGVIESVDEENIKFGLLMSTLRACEGTKMETEVLSMLEKVRSYSIENLQLSFLDENGNIIAKYKKVD